MPEISVNGTLVDYPNVGDVDWGTDATNFAILTSAALGKLGLASGTSVDIGQTLDVTGNTTLDANLSVGGNTTLTGILNVDSGVLYVDPTNNRVGINDATPSVELDVNGAVSITGNETVGGTLEVTGDFAVNTNKFNVTASSGNTTIAGTLGVSGNTTIDGVTYLDDDTTANTPVLSFTGDTNTGIGRSAADTLDLITGGNSRFRIEPTGQIKAVYESTIGSDYNTQLDNGYLCRAWVNFNGTGTPAIRSSGNVSSITDNGTGDYTVNFTSALPDANYSVLGSASNTNLAPQYGLSIADSTTTRTVSLFRVCCFNTVSSSAFDSAQISIGVFR